MLSRLLQCKKPILLPERSTRPIRRMQNGHQRNSNPLELSPGLQHYRRLRLQASSRIRAGWFFYVGIYIPIGVLHGPLSVAEAEVVIVKGE